MSAHWSADAVLAALSESLPGWLDGPRPVLLVDGRSGAGKTELAAAIARRTGFASVPLDVIHPGWDGLEAGSRAVHDTVLRRVDPGYRRWDWLADAPGEWVSLDARQPLVIEGCGALSRTNRALASAALWIEAPAELRYERAIARDGEAYAQHWDRWAAQEEAFIAREHPAELADLVLRAG